MGTNELPSFVAIKEAFSKFLSPGQRAEIRRARSPDDLVLIPAYYRLLKFLGLTSCPQLQRVVYLLHWANHQDTTGNIGESLAKSKIGEMRLFQMARTEDSILSLQRLRRLCQHAKPTLDWNEFGRTLYYWGKKARQSIVEDYFIHGGGR